MKTLTRPRGRSTDPGSGRPETSILERHAEKRLQKIRNAPAAGSSKQPLCTQSCAARGGGKSRKQSNHKENPLKIERSFPGSRAEKKKWRLTASAQMRRERTQEATTKPRERRARRQGKETTTRHPWECFSSIARFHSPSSASSSAKVGLGNTAPRGLTSH